MGTEFNHPEQNVHRKTVIVCDKLNIYTEAGEKSVSACTLCVTTNIHLDEVFFCMSVKWMKIGFVIIDIWILSQLFPKGFLCNLAVTSFVKWGNNTCWLRMVLLNNWDFEAKAFGVQPRAPVPRSRGIWWGCLSLKLRICWSDALPAGKPYVAIACVGWLWLGIFLSIKWNF